MRRAYLPPYNDSDMNYKKLLPLFAIALLTSAAFTACSTDTPKTEKTDGKKDPHTDGSTGATTKPGTPVTPTPADPKENLPALREGEVRIAVPQAGRSGGSSQGERPLEGAHPSPHLGRYQPSRLRLHPLPK